MYKFNNGNELNLYTVADVLASIRTYFQLPKDIDNKISELEKEIYNLIPSECYDEEFADD